MMIILPLTGRYRLMVSADRETADRGKKSKYKYKPNTNANTNQIQIQSQPVTANLHGNTFTFQFLKPPSHFLFESFNV